MMMILSFHLNFSPTQSVILRWMLYVPMNICAANGNGKCSFLSLSISYLKLLLIKWVVIRKNNMNHHYRYLWNYELVWAHSVIRIEIESKASYMTLHIEILKAEKHKWMRNAFKMNSLLHVRLKSPLCVIYCWVIDRCSTKLECLTLCLGWLKTLSRTIYYYFYYFY